MSIDRRDFLKLPPKLLVGVSTLSLGGCDGNVGHFDALVVNHFDADIALPELDQQVTLSWSYSFDDPAVQQRNPNNRITSQQLIIKRLHLVGIAEQKIGPNATTNTPPTPNTPALDVATRTFSFKFNGPIVVQIQASFDQTNAPDNSDFRAVCSAMLTLRLHQELFCQANFSTHLGQQNVLYPYLGYAQDAQGRFETTSTIDFTQFVVFRDAGTLGQMDLAAQAPQLFDAGRPFRALSFSAQENEGFKTISGSAYPPQVFTQPQAGLTNAMLFAGAIVFNGQPLKGNTDARSSVFTGGPVDQQSIPIFLAMPMLFGEIGGSFTIADIHAGSALDIARTPSGQRPLVLTSLSTPGQLEVGNLGSISENLTLVPSGSGHLHKGGIKGARIVHGVTTLNNDIFDSTVDVSFSWQCQFLPDNQLNQVLDLGTG